MTVTNTFGIKKENSVVKQISHSIILQPEVKPANRSIKWYEDKKKS